MKGFESRGELLLKYVIRHCNGCTPDVRDWLTRTHRLDLLWNKLAEIYPRFDAWSDAETTAACRELVMELQLGDPTSEAGRYPVFRDGTQTLTTVNSIDLVNLKTGARKISHWLSTVIEQIGQDHEWQAEKASW